MTPMTRVTMDCLLSSVGNKEREREVGVQGSQTVVICVIVVMRARVQGTSRGVITESGVWGG